MEGDLILSPATAHCAPDMLVDGEQADNCSEMSAILTTNGLPAILDLTFAKPLRDSLAALFGAEAITLNAGAVERMSTPCAQVLLAAGRAAVSSGITFRIRDPSPVFRAALIDLGLESVFSDWMD